MSIFVKENHKNKNVAYPEVWITTWSVSSATCYLEKRQHLETARCI